MTFMRYFHRLAWCSACKMQTPHDEDGKGLCVSCQDSIREWIDALDKAPIEAEFNNVDDLLVWLNDEPDSPVSPALRAPIDNKEQS